MPCHRHTFQPFAVASLFFFEMTTTALLSDGLDRPLFSSGFSSSQLTEHRNQLDGQVKKNKIVLSKGRFFGAEVGGLWKLRVCLVGVLACPTKRNSER